MKVLLFNLDGSDWRDDLEAIHKLLPGQELCIQALHGSRLGVEAEIRPMPSSQELDAAFGAADEQMIRWYLRDLFVRQTEECVVVALTEFWQNRWILGSEAVWNNIALIAKRGSNLEVLPDLVFFNGQPVTQQQLVSLREMHKGHRAFWYMPWQGEAFPGFRPVHKPQQFQIGFTDSQNFENLFKALEIEHDTIVLDREFIRLYPEWAAFLSRKTIRIVRLQ